MSSRDYFSSIRIKLVRTWISQMSHQLRMVAHFLFHFSFFHSVYYCFEFAVFHTNSSISVDFQCKNGITLNIHTSEVHILCCSLKLRAHPMTLFVEQTAKKCLLFKHTANERTIESHTKFHILQDAHNHLFSSMCFMHSPGVMTKQNFACFLIFPHYSYGHYAVFPRPQ